MKIIYKINSFISIYYNKVAISACLIDVYSFFYKINIINYLIIEYGYKQSYFQ